MQRHGFASRTTLLALSLLVLGVGVGFAAGIAGSAFAEERGVGRGGVADLVRSIISKKPNMVIEDHAEISCEREFSVKLFTSEKLTSVEFEVFDAASGALLFGPLGFAEILPLWETIPLGPLSALPPKIVVKMKALSPGGETRTDELILEPDCKTSTIAPTTSITNKVIIIHPVGKWLWNPPPWPPLPPFPPLEGQYTRVPLTVAVPREAIGKPLVATMIWQDPTGVRRYVAAESLETIQTEMLSLDLRSANPISIPGGISPFFDVFVDVAIGTPEGPGLTRALGEGTASLPPVEHGDMVVLPDGSSHNLGDSFFDIFVDFEFVRMLDARPLELPSTGGTEHTTTGTYRHHTKKVN